MNPSLLSLCYKLNMRIQDPTWLQSATPIGSDHDDARAYESLITGLSLGWSLPKISCFASSVLKKLMRLCLVRLFKYGTYMAFGGVTISSGFMYIPYQATWRLWVRGGRRAVACGVLGDADLTV